MKKLQDKTKIDLSKYLYKTTNHKGETKIRAIKNPFLLFSRLKQNLFYFKCVCGNIFPLTERELQMLKPTDRCPYCNKLAYEKKKENYKTDLRTDRFVGTLTDIVLED